MDVSAQCDVELHIGLAKTGSTAIQSYLSANRRELLDAHGILFPQSLGETLSSHLAAACQLGSEPDDLRSKRGLLTTASVHDYRRQLAEQLEEEITRARPQRLVVSCEHFSSRLLDDDEVACLEAFLRPFARSIRVWVYLRRQDELYRSAYTTAVRSGRSAVFSWPEVGSERPDLHFERLLDRWSRVFSSDALRVRLYDRARLRENNVVDDFCRAASLPATLARPEVEANTALDTESLEFLRSFNAHVPYFAGNAPNPLRNDINAAVASFPGRSEQAFGPPGAAAFYARFAGENERVRQRYVSHAMDAPEGLFEAAADSPDSSGHAAATPDRLVQLCAHLWCHAQTELRAEQLRSALLMVELALARGELDNAEELLDTLLERQPEDPQVWSLRARLARRRRDRRAARSYARRAEELRARN
jgi:hypothetical protein